MKALTVDIYQGQNKSLFNYMQTVNTLFIACDNNIDPGKNITMTQ